ncbi:translocation and assembly module TamB [Cricetibacter osteomyelitidis]|uniref:Translocation and assembly module TamB n=1 Tax=Cricetibacter osteomyelitidis TaxID=1521931 RepID=A0A4R2SRK0_9PAST|nr:translocation/assembly module TamB domain-containing protein [Cricetibacter osteomyelitidis]TCP91231.1 translocation and assembly module TamB [Cricetibacter osteomyelitidis]
MSEQEQTQENADKSIPIKKKKWCRRALCITSAVIFVPVFGVLGMLATDIGQRTLVKLADKFVDQLSIGDVTGGLSEGLELSNVRFQTDGVETWVEKARLQLDFGCLWERKICVDDITINKPQVKVDIGKIPPSEKKREESSGSMQRIELLISIVVKNIAVDAVDVTVDNMAIRLADFKSAVNLDNESGLTLSPTVIDGVNFTINQVEQTVQPTEPVQTESEPLDLRALEAALRKPLLSALAEMKKIELPFDIHVQDLQGSNWQYQDSVQTITVPKLQLQADAAGYDVQLQNLDVISSMGTLQAQGKITLNNDFPLDLQLNSNVETIKQENVVILPKTALNLSVSGNLLKQTALSLTATGGVNAQIKANAELNSEKTPLNLSVQSKQIQYPLAGKAQVKLNNVDLKLSGDLLNYHTELKSIFNSKNLALSGRLGLKNDVWNLPDLLFVYGENKISGKGNLNPDSQKLTFNVDINAPNLSGLMPDLTANIVGKAKVFGKLTEPNVDLELTTKSLKFQDLNVQNLVASGKITTDKQIQGDLAVDLASLTYGEGVDVHNLALNFTGSETKHELHLRSQGKPVAAELNIAGSFDRTSQVWKGTLSNTNIQSLIGDLKNSQNVAVIYDNKAQQVTVGAHCWQNPNLELCLPQQFKAGAGGEVPFAIKRLNLQLINEITEQDNLLKGVLSSQGKVAWFANKPVAFNIQVDGNNLAVAQKLNGRMFNLPIPKLAVSGKLENNNLASKADVHLQDRALIAAEFNLQDIAKSRKLGGKLAINNLSLKLANQLLARNENVDGAVQANLTFGGDLKAPLLNGSFDIRSIRAKSASMPFDVKSGDIALRFNGRSSTLQGNIQTDEGRLDIDGDASWHNLNSWTGRVHTKANNFKLDIPSMAKIKVSPDVTVKATPKLLELTGEVNIPWARIVIESLPESAVSVSSDEVILDGSDKKQSVATSMKATQQRMKAAAEADGMAIKADLKINIGDDVSIEAYGLKSDLRGLLSVKQEKGQLGLYGQVNLFRGRFASFGQDLIIRKGEISFAGLPSQPFLNIEAIRNPEAMEDSSITAGVKVTGVADAPEVKVFSEPSTSQDQALSYILTGRSLENSGEAGSAGSVGAALLGMSLAKSGKAVGKIGETFGISDLSLGTQGVGDNSKVTVSGNITDRLQIKYGVGLFDGLAEVTLRYRLLPRLYLQSVSGTNQAFDLLYQFQF